MSLVITIATTSIVLPLAVVLTIRLCKYHRTRNQRVLVAVRERIKQHGGWCVLNDVTDYFRMHRWFNGETSVTLSIVLDGLVRRGFVDRDLRHRLRLTDKGFRAVERAMRSGRYPPKT